MTEHEASRTLVKSPPELWAECSDAASLNRHLNDCFGEIRITRLEPETAVAWEGERGSGTVRLEPSGWGTRVILTAQAQSQTPAHAQAQAPGPAQGLAPAPAPAPDRVAPPPSPTDPADPPDAEPAVAPQPDAASPVQRKAPRRGLFSRLFSRNQPSAPTRAPDPVPRRARPTTSYANPSPADPSPAPPSPAPPSAGPPSAGPPSPAAPSPAPPSAGQPAAERPAASPDPAAVLTAALDSLGQAHHRPFSRA